MNMKNYFKEVGKEGKSIYLSHCITIVHHDLKSIFVMMVFLLLYSQSFL